jgi:cell wall assembly regulator SMI1
MEREDMSISNLWDRIRGRTRASAPMERGEPEMSTLWRQLEAWLSTHWPDGLSSLNPPATQEDISALEAALGAKLPPSFIDCLKVHNGQSDAAGLFDGFEFLSTGEILDQWSAWSDLLDAGELDGMVSEPEPGVRPDWWHVRWIPITHNGGGDHVCLDLAPAGKGQVGQVITMWHDMGARAVLAASFEQWFRQYVAAVLAGAYAYSEDAGGLVSAEVA